MVSMRMRNATGFRRLSIMIPILILTSVQSLAALPIKWHDALDQPRDWYSSDEAVRIADNLIVYQRDSGGWPKNIDMAASLTDTDRAGVLNKKSEADSTIDNGATYSQLIFLARVYTAKQFSRHKESFLIGLDYLLNAQYDNGGWPQYFPRKKGYYEHITFNDNAMIGVMRLLRDIAQGRSDYLFVDEIRKQRAAKAVAKGVECILKTQVKVRGRLTVWCAQHDENTLAPAPARAFEPVSLSGDESVGIVEFLMGIENPDSTVIEAIKSAVAWFQNSELNGIRWVETAARDHVVVRDPNAPPLWARFYDIETTRPIFTGRDGVIKYDVAEIESERRNGYRWYTNAPAKLLGKEYPAWLKKIGQIKPTIS